MAGVCTHKKQRPMEWKTDTFSSDLRAAASSSLLLSIFVFLDTQISTQRSVSPAWRKWTISEIQTTPVMAVMQWWITLMFPLALNPLKCENWILFSPDSLPFLNCFLNYWNEKLQTRLMLAIPPILPQSHFLPFSSAAKCSKLESLIDCSDNRRKSVHGICMEWPMCKRIFPCRSE